ncbi:hypothetical protein E4K64_01590 [Bradyrhizobium frederickii]|uniref:Uncharacterized protein n=1 Tax=Bradyrhizobium frederickii TaxID=2560054 RepID=A0A4Y9PJC3_9BRAD|nr:hypothetical protein E4K64_01590 [Bradyrhizobium frederickii]
MQMSLARIFRCAVGPRSFGDVMAGPCPGHPVLANGTKNVDARDKPGHDDLWARNAITPPPRSSRSRCGRSWR